MSRVFSMRFDREESSCNEKITCDMCGRVTLERAIVAELRGNADVPTFLVRADGGAALFDDSRDVFARGSTRCWATSPVPVRDFCESCKLVVLDLLRERGLREPSEITRVVMPCPDCRGTGTRRTFPGLFPIAPSMRIACGVCNGRGWAHDSSGAPIVREFRNPRLCRNPDCREGSIPLARCPECKGALVIENEEA